MHLGAGGTDIQAMAQPHIPTGKNDFPRGTALPEVAHLERGQQIWDLLMQRLHPCQGTTVGNLASEGDWFQGLRGY